jgi:predicted phage terminase large subunit-like protein
MHAKSTSMTFFYPLFMALYEKKKFIVIISASEDSAKKFLRRIRSELEANSLIHYVFGPQKTDKWSETELRLQNGTTIIAKGRGAQMRGLLSGHTRPDLAILDDLEDDELVRSQMRRLDLEDWFNGAVLPTLAPKSGTIVYVGTILHEDSLLNRLLNKKLYPDFKSLKYAAIDKDTNEALWPERFSMEDLLRKKEAYIARDKLANFYMEYLNDPIPQESAVFKPEFFQYYDDLPARNQLVTEVFIDLGGGSTKKTADPTAMVVLCLDKHNTIFINDYINDKMGVDTKQIANAMFELYGKYRPSKFTIEKTTATNMIMQALNAEMIRRNTHLNVEYVNPTRGSGSDRRGLMSDGKYQRIAAMQAAFKLGVIKMRPWMTELKEQLQAFPRATHDDLTDALAYGYLFMQRRIDEMDDDEDDLTYEPLYPELGI